MDVLVHTRGHPLLFLPSAFPPPGADDVVLVLDPRTTALLFEPVYALESVPPLLVGGPRWREGLSYLVHLLRCPVGCLGGVFPGGPLPSSGAGEVMERCKMRIQYKFGWGPPQLDAYATVIVALKRGA